MKSKCYLYMLFKRTHTGTIILLQIWTVISFAQKYSAWHVTFPGICDSDLSSKTPRIQPMVSITKSCFGHTFPIVEFLELEPLSSHDWISIIFIALEYWIQVLAVWLKKNYLPSVFLSFKMKLIATLHGYYEAWSNVTYIIHVIHVQYVLFLLSTPICL